MQWEQFLYRPGSPFLSIPKDRKQALTTHTPFFLFWREGPTWASEFWPKTSSPPSPAPKKGQKTIPIIGFFFVRFSFNASNPGGEKGFLQKGVFRILVLVRPRCNIGSENRIPAGKLSLRWLQNPINVAFFFKYSL